MNYQDFYKQSLNEPEKFWEQQSQKIEWLTKPKSILSKDKNGYPVWFADGKLNLCYLAVDEHSINPLQYRHLFCIADTSCLYCILIGCSQFMLMLSKFGDRNNISKQ
jgi:hypothetical protein